MAHPMSASQPAREPVVSRDALAAETLKETLKEPPKAPQPGARADDELPRGAAIGRYVVLSKLGAGGMGVVYAAYDPELDRKVAIKLLHAAAHDGHGSGTEGRARLLREAQAMARLGHPNVVGIYDVGTLGERVFIAMEFIDGCTLTDWLRAQPRRRDEILEKFIAAGRGLIAAHAAGLVHRDFKPDNVPPRAGSPHSDPYRGEKDSRSTRSAALGVRIPKEESGLVPPESGLRAQPGGVMPARSRMDVAMLSMASG
jgi:hypothetical protein